MQLFYSCSLMHTLLGMKHFPLIQNGDAYYDYILKQVLICTCCTLLISQNYTIATVLTYCSKNVCALLAASTKGVWKP